MSLFTLFVTAVGLSMDAFAVSICKGLAMKKLSWRKALIIGLWFGGFQALMPTIGYLLGTKFESYVTAIDHWIAFVLLALIGANMIKEALSREEEEANDSIDVKTMFLLAIATSIDALAVGVTYAFLQVQIVPAVTFIGVITFSLSVVGVKIGNVFGLKYKSKAEITGGVILILMGTKILLEHLGLLEWLPF
ncbi:MAG: manganese efflux pump MntP family protein [Acetatifactor sp.]